MTEKQLRNKVVTIAKGWLGYGERTGQHRAIIDVYNRITPLPVGVRLDYGQHWCAAFTSAVGWKAGLSDIILPECSCSRMIALYKKAKRWKEADDYVPQPGDLVMYDWADGTNFAKTDNTGAPDHVGIVTNVTGDTVKVIEGNKDDTVGYRYLKINGRYIRGYCLPDYASKASTPTTAVTPVVLPAKSFDKSLARSYTVTASALNMRRGPNLSNGVLKVLAKGETVRCYGYYTKNGATTWLYVKDKDGDIGYCSKKYLE